MVEFINLHQEEMSVQEYSLKFTQFSKYAPTMVANPRSRISKFVIGVSSLLEKECRMTMLLNDVDICRFMVYAQQIEESKIREIRQEGKRPRSDDSSYQKPKNRLFHQKSSMGNKDRDPNQHFQGGGHNFERTTCVSCGKQHLGKCLARTDGCFEFGSKGHKMRDCPRIKARGNRLIKILKVVKIPMLQRRTLPMGRI